ncbi:hypothetical protein AB0K51_31505 [Kitasatospora sp. NPDC049285]|uniref:hypothetical protein n=1 Tax=Kitasatospora sp. NPDC049285 TaxID=3157096 RepID=UPI003440C520
MNHIRPTAKLLVAGLAPALLAAAAVLGLGTPTTPHAQGPVVAPLQIIAPHDTSWGGCGAQCNQQP